MLLWRRDCTLTSRRSCFCHDFDVLGVDDNQTNSNAICAQRLFLSSLHAAALSKLLLSLFLSPIPSNAHCSLEEEEEEEETGHKFPLRHRYINQSTNTPSRNTELWNLIASSSSSEKSTYLPTCLEDKSFWNGKKESWRSKKSPLNATKHDQKHGILRINNAEILPGREGGRLCKWRSQQKKKHQAKSYYSEPNRGEAIDGNLHRRAVTERNSRGKFWIFAGVRILLQTCWSSGGRRERATSPPVAVPPANGNRQTAKESLTATVVPSQSCFFFFFFAAKFFIFKF